MVNEQSIRENVLLVYELLDEFIVSIIIPVNAFSSIVLGVAGWCEGAVYLTSLGRPTDIGLQLGKACYPCSG